MFRRKKKDEAVEAAVSAADAGSDTATAGENSSGPRWINLSSIGGLVGLPGWGIYRKPPP